MDRRNVGTATRRETLNAADLASERLVRAATGERDDSPPVHAHESLAWRIERAARDSRAVRTAWVLLDQHMIAPVPLDPDNLEPAGEPLDTVEALLGHYEAHPEHGIGVTTGKHPHRDWTYVAVEVELFAHWNDWLHEAAKVTDRIPNLGGFADLGMQTEAGPPIERVRYRDSGAFSRLFWVPPPLPRMAYYWLDAKGGDLTRTEESRQAGRGGWVWLAVAGHVEVRKGRKIADGLRLLPDGACVPWENTRTADGWQLRLEASAHSHHGLAPARAGVAPWLIEALTGK